MKKIIVSQLNNAGVPRYDNLTTWETEYLAHLVRDAEDVSLGSAGINVAKAYEDSVSLLRTKAGLNVYVGTYEYVRFADASTEQICASYWGDHIGICDASMKAILNTGSSALTTQFRGKPITSFDEFQRCTGLTSTPGDGEHNGSFQGCTKLKSIAFPTVTPFFTINRYSFDGDSSLAELKNTASVKQIGACAFRNCVSLSNIDSLKPTEIRESAFQNCKSITNIDLTGLSSSLDASYIFDGCEKLGSSLNMANMPTVGNYCFQNCKSLESLLNVDSLKTIGKYSFNGCDKLSSFSSGFAPNIVDDYSFQNCKNLPSFKLGNCSRVGKYAFNGDSSLTSFNFNDSSCVLDENAFMDCSLLTNILNTNHLNVISANAFKNCKSLTGLNLSKNGKTALSNINAFDGTTTNIYVGDATYPYRDNKNLKLYLNDASWGPLSSRLDTQYNNTIDLSTGYRRVNYIQSDRVRMIETGLDFTNDTRFVADIAFLLPGTGTDGAVYGSATNGLKGTTANGVRFSFTDHTQNLVSSSDWLDGNERLFDIRVNENKMLVNELVKYEGEGSTSVVGEDITLFGNGNSKFMGKGWMTKIYQGGELVRFYTPCIEESTGKVGYYDKINNTFTGYTTYLCEGVERIMRDENNEVITDEEGNTIAI